MSHPPIPLARPCIPPSALERVAAVLTSGHLTEGTVTRQFEESFAAFVGVRHAVAVTSCTTGLELALRAMGIGPGDEVIVPDYTYPASAMAVMLTGATAVIVDVDADTLNVNYEALETAITSRTRALMPVSIFGNPLDWDVLDSIAKRHKLPMLEDAACSLGSAFKNIRTGNFGAAAVFSLHPRKSITTGEGGMITTNDDALAARLRSCKRFGLDTVDGERELLRFAHLGTNLKMSDIVAAIGLAQMEIAEAIFAQRAALAARYTQWLAPLITAGQLRLPQTPQGGVHGWQSYCILLECTDKKRRDIILATLRAQGIEVQIGTYALHREPVFQKHPLCRVEGRMTGSVRAYEQTLALPLFHDITEEQQRHVVDALTLCLAGNHYG